MCDSEHRIVCVLHMGLLLRFGVCAAPGGVPPNLVGCRMSGGGQGGPRGAGPGVAYTLGHLSILFGVFLQLYSPQKFYSCSVENGKDTAVQYHTNMLTSAYG